MQVDRAGILSVGVVCSSNDGLVFHIVVEICGQTVGQMDRYLKSQTRIL